MGVHLWTTGTTVALTGQEAQNRHRWHQNNLSLAPESLAPDSQHLKWTFNYLEVLLGGKFLTGQEPEKKEANGRKFKSTN